MVKIDNKTLVIIEMQNKFKSFYEYRAEFYMAKQYLEQFTIGFDYENASKIILISIVDFIFVNRDTYHSISSGRLDEIESSKKVGMPIKDEETTHLNSKLEKHILELPKIQFKQKNSQINLSSDLEQWLSFIAMTKKGEIDMELVQQYNTQIQEVFNQLQTMTLTKAQKLIYESKLRDLTDTRNDLKYEYQKGEAVGQKNKAIKIAKTLIKSNIDENSIMEWTGLNKEEIKKLRD